MKLLLLIVIGYYPHFMVLWSMAKGPSKKSWKFIVIRNIFITLLLNGLLLIMANGDGNPNYYAITSCSLISLATFFTLLKKGIRHFTMQHQLKREQQMKMNELLPIKIKL
ncbi:hypothetical protein D3C78_19260 [compost metagenome]